MIRFKLVLAAMVFGLVAAGSAFAQGRGGGRGGPGGPGGMFGRSPFDNYVAALADLNLTPDFTLTADVKKQVQAVRDDWKKANDDFKTAHKDELDKAQAAIRDAMQAQDREAGQTARQALQDINAKGPKAEEYIAKIKALLTPEQADAVDKKEKEMQPPMPGGRGGPGGGGPGGPPAN